MNLERISGSLIAWKIFIVCWIIYIGVPAEARSEPGAVLPRALETSDEWSLRFESLFGKKYRAFRYPEHFCACDLFHQPRNEPTQSDEERLREKYRKKGWSEAKIQRAVTAAMSSAKRPRTAGLIEGERAMVAQLAREVGRCVIVVVWEGEKESAARLGNGMTAEQMESGSVVLKEDEVQLVFG